MQERNRMCKTSEFQGMTQIFQSQQVFLLTSLISGYKYKARQLLASMSQISELKTNQPNLKPKKKCLEGTRDNIHIFSFISTCTDMCLFFLYGNPTPEIKGKSAFIFYFLSAVNEDNN